jgi:GDP-D-mannose dehydratase
MALQTNGMVTSHLCDIIHRNKLKTKLFNASSSEIYKGHVNHTVTDADTHFYHRHPYSIAKAMGHSIVEFYRAEYGLPFSNGVLFTTESEHRLPAFLLSKVANHIKDWIPDKLPLEVGNLDSYRNVIHATDVARAIRVIVSQDYGDSYVICNEESHTMVDIVMRMLSIAGFTVELRHGVIIYDVVSDTPIIIIRTSLAGNEPAPTDIRGISTKLKALGWVPTMSDINQVLRESYGTK